jgi:hypothetical protein
MQKNSTEKERKTKKKLGERVNAQEEQTRTKQ